MAKSFKVAAIVLLALLMAACARGGESSETPLAEAGAGPSVIILAPASGTTIPTGREVEIQSSASDAGSISRIELFIAGELIALDPAPAEQGTFAVTQRWVPVEPGSYTVEVIAYNALGQRSPSATIALTVAGEGLAPVLPTSTTTDLGSAPAPEATQPPAEVQPTAAAPTESVAGIQGTVTIGQGVNVRAAPDVSAERVGGLWLNNPVTAIARNAAGDWVKVRYTDEGGEKVGWLFASLVAWQGDLNSLPQE